MAQTGLEQTQTQQSATPDWKWDIIYRAIDPELIQQNSATEEQILQALYLKWHVGTIRIIGSKQHRFVVVIVPKTQFVCEVHIFSDSDGMFDAVKGAKLCLQWIWDNTNYVRVEARTPLSKVCALAKRIGMQQEGVRKGSFVTNDNTRLDEYEYGINKPEDTQ